MRVNVRSAGGRGNRIIQGLWVGSRLTLLEQLSIQSFLAHGHEFHLYVYEPVENVPEGTVVRDGNEVLSSDRIFKYRDHDSYAGFSNYFRYKLLHTRGGWWVDLDLICLKPFDFGDDYVFSSEDAVMARGHDIHVNVGAVKSPAGAPLMEHLWEQCRRKDPSELRWGEIGPILFSESIRQFEMQSFVAKPNVFCPISYLRWKDMLDPDVRFRFTDETYAVHLWNEMWRREGFDKDDSYDESCLFERLKAMYLQPTVSPRERTAAATFGPVLGNTSCTPRPAAASENTASPKVSAVVLSKNGSARIARCLESIRISAFADEVVVCVDADTTDDTFQVARTFTPNVHVVKTSGYLESALATITSLCSCDFVLRIDDDECLAGNWEKASFQLLAAYNRLTAVWIPTRWVVPPGDSFLASAPWFPDPHPRLYINDPSRILWPEHVHEHMLVTGRSIRLFDRWIDHYNLVDRPKGERRRRSVKYRELNGKCEPDFYLYEDHEHTILPCNTTALALLAVQNRRASVAPSYSLDSLIDFSATGDAVSYLGGGWGHAEDWGTWTVGYQARICLPLAAPPDSGAVVSVEVAAYLNAAHPTLHADVFYADVWVAQWTFDRAGFITLTVNIDPDLIAGDSRPCFTFRIADPRSPMESGESADDRLLGLGFKSLRLRSDGVAPTSRLDRSAPAGTSVNGPVRPAVHGAKSKEALVNKAIHLGQAALPGAGVDVYWEQMWIVRVDGFFFPLPDVTAPEMIPWEALAGLPAQYSHDAKDYWYFGYRPKAGDVVVDIGAGRGEDTFAFSRSVGDTGRVFAIEPHPVSFAVLDKFCSWNGLSNVTRLNVACVAKPGQLQIETLPNWQSNYVTQAEPTPTSFAVSGVTFDSVSKKYAIGRIDLLKMNIEGAERDALPGSRCALAQTKNVCIAAHDFKADRGDAEWYRTKAFVRELLEDCGFRITTRNDDPRDWARDHIHGTRW